MPRFIFFIGFFIITSLLLFSCRKSNDTAINISGYTSTDEQGNITGQSYDSTDWKINRAIPAKMQDTLDAMSLSTDTNHILPGTIDELQDTEYVVGAYPNPCTVAFAFYEKKGGSSRYCCKLVLVDNHLLVCSRGVLPGSGTLALQVGGLQSGLYRLYYSFYNDQNHVLTSGYGDINKQ